MCASQRKREPKISAAPASPQMPIVEKTNRPKSEKVLRPKKMRKQAEKTVDVLDNYRKALKKNDVLFTGTPEAVAQRRNSLDALDMLLSTKEDREETIETFQKLYSTVDVKLRSKVDQLCADLDEVSEGDFAAQSIKKEELISSVNDLIKDWRDAQAPMDPEDLLEHALLSFPLKKTKGIRGFVVAAVYDYKDLKKPLTAIALTAWIDKVWDSNEDKWARFNASLGIRKQMCDAKSKDFFASANESLDEVDSKGIKKYIPGAIGGVLGFLVGAAIANIPKVKELGPTQDIARVGLYGGIGALILAPAVQVLSSYAMGLSDDEEHPLKAILREVARLRTTGSDE